MSPVSLGNLRILLLLALAFVSSLGFSQTKEIEDVQERADLFFQQGDYLQAKDLYSQLVSLYPKDENYNYRFGACLMYVDEDKSYAIKFLEYAVSKPNVEVDAFYFLGKGYHYNYRFDEAILYFNKYKNKRSPKDKAIYPVDQDIRFCQNGKLLLRNITTPLVMKRSKVSAADFFTSFKIKDMGGRMLYAPKELHSSIDKKKGYVPVMYKNSNSNIVYFSSYGDNDKNGLDLFQVFVADNGVIGKPIRLPETINTAFDERFPFLTEDQSKFYFSSTGHNSMGGADIYVASFDSITKQFGAPVNLDYSVNTPDDDFMYAEVGDEGVAFFASNRNCEKGKAYVYKINAQRKEYEIAVLAGFFNSEATKSCKITVEDLEEHVVVGTFNTNKKSGQYVMRLKNGGKYSFLVEPYGGDVAYKGIVDLPKLEKTKVLRQEIQIVKEDSGERLIIRNLFEEESTPEDQKIIAQVYAENANIEESKEPEITISSDEMVTQLEQTKLVQEKKMKELVAQKEASFLLANNKRELAHKDLELADQLEKQIDLNEISEENSVRQREFSELIQDARVHSEEAASAFEIGEKYESQIKEAQTQLNQTEGYILRIKSAASENSGAVVNDLYTNFQNDKVEIGVEQVAQGVETAIEKEEGRMKRTLDRVAIIEETQEDLKSEIAYTKASKLATKKKKEKEVIQLSIDNLQAELAPLEEEKKSSLAKASQIEVVINELRSERVLLREVKSSSAAENVSSDPVTIDQKNAMLVSIQATSQEIDALEEVSKKMLEEETTPDQLATNALEQESINGEMITEEDHPEITSITNEISEVKEINQLNENEISPTVLAKTPENQATKNTEALINPLEISKESDHVSVSKVTSEEETEVPIVVKASSKESGSENNSSPSPPVVGGAAVLASGSNESNSANVQDVSKENETEENILDKGKPSDELVITEELESAPSTKENEFFEYTNEYEEPVDAMVWVAGEKVPLEITSNTGKLRYKEEELKDAEIAFTKSLYNQEFEEQYTAVKEETNQGTRAKETQRINYNWVVAIEKEIAELAYAKENSTNEAIRSRFNLKIAELKEQASQKRNFMALNARIIKQLDAQESLAMNAAEEGVESTNVESQTIPASSEENTENPNAINEALGTTTAEEGVELASAEQQTISASSEENAESPNAINEALGITIAEEGVELASAEQQTISGASEENTETPNAVNEELGTTTAEEGVELASAEQQTISASSEENAESPNAVNEALETTTAEEGVESANVEQQTISGASEENAESPNAVNEALGTTTAEEGVESANVELQTISGASEENEESPNAVNVALGTTTAEEGVESANVEQQTISGASEENEESPNAINEELEPIVTEVANESTSTTPAGTTLQNQTEEIENAMVNEGSSEGNLPVKTADLIPAQEPQLSPSAAVVTEIEIAQKDQEKAVQSSVKEREILMATIENTKKKKEKRRLAQELVLKDAEVAYQKKKLQLVEAKKEDALAAEGTVINDPIGERPSDAKYKEARKIDIRTDELESELQELEYTLSNTKKKKQRRVVEAEIVNVKNDISESKLASRMAKESATEMVGIETETLKKLTPYGSEVLVKLPEIENELTATQFSEVEKKPAYMEYMEVKEESEKEIQAASVSYQSSKNKKEEAAQIESEISVLKEGVDLLPEEEKGAILSEISEKRKTQKRILAEAEVMYQEAKLSENEAYFNLNEANSKLLVLENTTERTLILTAIGGNIQTPVEDVTYDSSNIDAIPVALTTDIFVDNDSTFYNASKPIPVDVALPNGVILKVQIGAFRNPIDQTTFKGFAPIVGEKTTSGLTRYTAGLFKDFTTANSAKEGIRSKGYADAFVVAYLDGKRISISEARRVLAGEITASDVVQTAAPVEIDSSNEPNETVRVTEINSVPLLPGQGDIQVAPSSTREELFFTVQVGVYSQTIQPGSVLSLTPLNSENIPNNLVRYSSGVYGSIAQATAARTRIVQNGISDAFVTVYYKGSRITLAEARSLIASGTVSNTSNTLQDESEIGTEQTPDIVNVADSEINSLDNENVTYFVAVGPYAGGIPVGQAREILKLNALGVVVEKNNNATLYKIGNFTSLQEAEALKVDLQAKGLTNPAVIKNEK